MVYIAALLCEGVAIMDNQNIFRVSKKQIGNTLYTVKTLPSERATETVERKLVRFISERVSAEVKSVKNPVFTR